MKLRLGCQGCVCDRILLRRSLAQRFEKRHQENPESRSVPEHILRSFEWNREQNVSARARLRTYVEVAINCQRSFLHASQAQRGGCRPAIENRVRIKAN